MNKKEVGISDIELIQYLDHCIDAELSKPVNAQDMELIERYNAVIEWLQPDMYKPDPVIKARQLKIIRDEQKRNARKRFVKRFNKIAAAVAIAVVSISTLTVVASASMNMTPMQLIQELGNKLFGLNQGEPVDFGNITIIRGNGDSIKYPSLEEALKNEQLDIYYPAWLPYGVQIQSVYVNESNGIREVLFIFDSDSVKMSIECGKKYEMNLDSSDYIKESIGGINVYSLNYGNRIYAKLDLDGNEYSITVDNVDVLKKIIENLSKGIY